MIIKKHNYGYGKVSVSPPTKNKLKELRMQYKEKHNKQITSIDILRILIYKAVLEDIEDGKNR